MRRVHVTMVQAGQTELDAAQVRHLQTVLRLRVGDSVEVFDDHGVTAVALLASNAHGHLVAQVEHLSQPQPSPLEWTIASAVPKGPRIDWMIEKLSELGATAFLPLAAARSVVLPEGSSKRQRWCRLAAQAAEQSRRAGVMRIEDLIELPRWLANPPHPAWYFSTAASAQPIGDAIATLTAKPARHLTLLIGPEGGWTDQEIDLMNSAGLTAVSLGTTILRIETAAVAAAAVVATVLVPSLAGGPKPVQLEKP